MQRVTAEEFIELIRSSDRSLIGGSGNGHAAPEVPILKTMDARLSQPEPIALAAHLAGRASRAGSARRASAALSIAGE